MSVLMEVMVEILIEGVIINVGEGGAGRQVRWSLHKCPYARVFVTHYGAKLRGRIIIQGLYDFPRSYSRRNL